MLWNQLGDIVLDLLNNILFGLILIEDLLEQWIVNILCHTDALRINIRQIVTQVNHQVGKNLRYMLLIFYHHIRNCSVLELYGNLLCDQCSCFQFLTGYSINRILCQLAANDTILKMQLLVELVSSDLRQIISLRIEEHTVQKILCAVYGKWLTRTKLLVKLKQTILIILCSILLNTCKDLWLLTKHLLNLCVGTKTKSTQKYSDRNLSVSINTDEEDIIGIRLILQPCTTIWDYCRRE